MRNLILSDIHANLEALEAVLASAAGRYDRIVCCGDLIGYGADPNAVTEWVRANVGVVVRGNHDRASVGMEDLEWFNPVARAAALWTQGELTDANAAYVRALPKGPVEVDGFQVVHGSPLDEDEYIMNSSEAGQVFDYVRHPVAFFGHTHVQGGFIWERARVRVIDRTPRTCGWRLFEFEEDRAYLLNPGSVGQPRDADPRAAYVLYDPDEGFLFYHRVEYDVAKAQDKIRRAGLPPLLADRLASGR